MVLLPDQVIWLIHVGIAAGHAHPATWEAMEEVADRATLEAFRAEHPENAAAFAEIAERLRLASVVVGELPLTG